MQELEKNRLRQQIGNSVRQNMFIIIGIVQHFERHILDIVGYQSKCTNQFRGDTFYFVSDMQLICRMTWPQQ